YGQTPIGDAELPAIVDCVNALGNVHGLDLGHTTITDAATHHLARLSNLTFLCLNGTSVTDRTLPYLRSVGGLTELVLSGTAITDAGVSDLLHLTLEFLPLYETGVSSEGLARLKARFPEALIEYG